MFYLTICDEVVVWPSLYSAEPLGQFLQCAQFSVFCKNKKATGANNQVNGKQEEEEVSASVTGHPG